MISFNFFFLFIIFFFFKQKTAYEMLRSLVGSEMCIRDSSIITTTTAPTKPSEVSASDQLLAAGDSLLLATKGAGVLSSTSTHHRHNFSVNGSQASLATARLLSTSHLKMVTKSVPFLHLVETIGYVPVSYTHLTLPTKRIV
eukprot:TRINITY_DN20904_c0_g3_i3.p1 TRINITY_DN20904_c0_g3~~TRINITY_DN20904_c0_g3_i3.p1  ORF type:complete len:142 (+),score=59.03 TRINITY_DN20904_c0_g3_i3:95-520(+)